MEEELEGIVLNENGSDDEGITLPNVEVEETEQHDTEVNSSDNNNQATFTEEEKESLKKGINSERERRKAAEKLNKELEARVKALEEATKTPQKTTLEELVEGGVDEEIAKSIATAIDSKKSDNSDLAKELAEVKFDNAIYKKSKEEGFEDIAEYSDEIKDLVDKGLSIEQSYYAVTYNKPKSKNTKSEIERKVEAKMQNNQERKEILGNYNNNSGASTTTKNKIKISSEERAIAAMSGMTPEEYVAVRDMNSVKDYDKYNAMKKK